MKTIICCLALLLTTEVAWAQSEDLEPTVKRNTIFVELGGPLAAYSINYDRRLRSFFLCSTERARRIERPLVGRRRYSTTGYLQRICWQGNHHFNVGIGTAYSNGNEELIRGGEKRQIRFQSVDADCSDRITACRNPREASS